MKPFWPLKKTYVFTFAYGDSLCGGVIEVWRWKSAYDTFVAARDYAVVNKSEDVKHMLILTFMEQV